MCVCVCVLSMFECRNEDVPNVILFLVLGVLYISFEGSLFNMVTCIGDEGSSTGNTEWSIYVSILQFIQTPRPAIYLAVYVV